MFYPRYHLKYRIKEEAYQVRLGNKVRRDMDPDSGQDGHDDGHNGHQAREAPLGNLGESQENDYTPRDGDILRRADMTWAR